MADKWYTQSVTEVSQHVSVEVTHGLSKAEVEKRRARYGLNELRTHNKTTALSLLLGQFKDVLILVLIAAATVSLFISIFHAHESPVEALLIYVIVAAIIAIGFFNEYKAERTVAALRKLVSFDARVLRGGREVKVPAKDLVPGDILLLEEGQKIPADARLVTANILKVNEASLTGESVPQTKVATTLKDAHLAIGDQVNMVFSGTVVASGTGKAIVVAIGNDAQIGRIAQLVSDTVAQATPMQQKLNQLGRMIGIVIFGVCAVAFFGVLLLDNSNSGDMVQRSIFAFTAAVALAVAAIPEGLAFVVRISLALGARRMATKHALVRRLAAVESLGSTDVICTDKTGTLTRGEMTVCALWQSGETFSLTGEGYATEGELQQNNKAAKPSSDLVHMLNASVLSNNATLAEGKLIGDPTELSLLVAAEKLGVNREDLSVKHPRLHEIPFSSERKMMSTVHTAEGKFLVAAKGAPEMLLTQCTHILWNGRVVALTAAKRKEVEAAVMHMTQQAFRVLGVATRWHAAKPHVKDQEQELVFVGLTGIMDPPRLEVKEVIQRVQTEAGMRVVMITGDNVQTAKAIAKELGIEGEAIAGVDLESMSDGALGQRAERIGVYARVNPEHKIRIVRALQASGHQVAMTGDGVNDAPALKAADIGIAMGITGTDAAKEASDLILLDDQFKTIIAAIEEGRGIFDNMRKFINFLLSTNTGLVVLVLLGILLHGNLVLSAVLLLFINIVTNGLPAVALGADVVAEGAMKRQPYEFQEQIITPSVWREMMIFGMLMAMAVLVHYSVVLANVGAVMAGSIAFLAVIIYTFARLVSIRAKYGLPWFSNPWLTVSVVGSLSAALLALYVPVFADVVGLQGVSVANWAVILVTAVGLVLIMRLLPFTRKASI